MPTDPSDYGDGYALTRMYAGSAAENAAHVAHRVELSKAERQAFDTTVSVCTEIATGRRS
jgi:hypothetical protein